MLYKFLLSILLLFNLVTCKDYKTTDPDVLISSACVQATLAFKFGANLTAANSFCDYEPAFGTVLACIVQHSSTNEISDSAKDVLIKTTCPQRTMKDINASFKNVTLNFNEGTTIPQNVAQYKPFPLPHDVFMKYFIAYQIYNKNFEYSNMLVSVILCYWTFVMAVSACHKLVLRANIAPKSSFAKKIQKFFILPNLYKDKHFQPIKFLKFLPCLLPTRIEATTIAIYVFILITSTVSNFEIDPTNALFKNRKEQVLRYLADRTGILCFGHLPLIFLFGSRNNILAYLTGFKFSTFIHFHKWTGRMMFLLAALHSFFFTFYNLDTGRYVKNITTKFFVQAGFASTILGAFIVGLSYYKIRIRWYEIFVVSHVFMAMFFLAGCYFHCKGLGWLEYVWAACGFWAFDLILRFCRIVYFGGFKRANLKLVSKDTLRVQVPKGRFRWSSEPGQYIFMQVLLPGCFWQSHPFTVCDSSTSDDVVTVYIKRKGGMTNRLFQILEQKPNKQDDSIRVVLEGPYGSHNPVWNYDNIVCIAGGNGITGPFDQTLKMARRYANSGKKNIQLHWVTRDLDSAQWFYDELKMLKNTRARVVLHLTRQQQQTDMLMEEVMEQVSMDEKEVMWEKSFKEIPLGTSVKSLDSDSDSDSDSNSGHSTVVDNRSPSKSSARSEAFSDLSSIYSTEERRRNAHEILRSFEVRFGRPDFTQLFEELFTEDPNASTAITSCGPAVVCDNLRNSIIATFEKSEARVDYFEELQTW